MSHASPQSRTLAALEGLLSTATYQIALEQVSKGIERYGQPLSASSPLANGELPTAENLPREILEELVDALAYAFLYLDLSGVDKTAAIVAAIQSLETAHEPRN